jgi:hypothetical protein
VIVVSGWLCPDGKPLREHAGDLPSQERRSWPEGLGGVRDELLGSKISGPIAQSWQRNWEHVVPFFAYPESVRRIIYDERDRGTSNT